MNFIIKDRKDRATKLVQWFENGEKRRKTFTTLTAAQDWIRDQRSLARTGSSPFEVSVAARAAAGTGFDLETLVKAGLERMREIGAGRADTALTVQEASEKIIARAIRTGARETTINGYRRAYAVINRDLGTRVAAALTQREIEDYLAKIPDRFGTAGQASLATKAGRLGHIRMCMGVAGVAKPLPDLELPEDESDVEFFTVREVKLALAVARPKERGFLAVALFGCVRPENLELLPEDCVSVESRRIRIPKGIAKDRNGHLLEEQLPPVIWDWLQLYPFQRVAWAPLQRRLKRAIGRWIHDGIRHTGATYYCALNGVGKTAQLLTHESERLVRRNYAGMVESTQTARDFMALKPGEIWFRETKDVVWPEPEILGEMLKDRTAVDVAEELGVSDSRLTRHCRARGINKPGRGHWTKVEYAAGG